MNLFSFAVLCCQTLSGISSLAIISTMPMHYLLSHVLALETTVASTL